MEGSATVVIAGLGAFNAFCPKITEAADVDIRRLRISQGYAVAATLVIGYLASRSTGSPQPMMYAVVIIGMELLAYQHSLSSGGILNA